MTTLLELISLANDSYKDYPEKINADGYYHPSSSTPVLAENWVGLPNKNESVEMMHCQKLVDMDSFFARLYGNIHTGETVIAFRGTEIGKNQHF